MQLQWLICLRLSGGAVLLVITGRKRNRRRRADEKKSRGEKWRGEEEQRRGTGEEEQRRGRAEERKCKGKGEIWVRGGPSTIISYRAQARLSAGLHKMTLSICLRDKTFVL